MCKPKSHGGLGFRCLRSFNIALLGKQAWRLTAHPDSLVSQIFRARYYPNGSFLTAKLGPSPSFVWRSILEAQEVVRRGINWRISSGRQVSILNELWLLNEANPFVCSRHPALEGRKVASLMIEGRREWDKDVIYDLFDEREAEAILAIPLPIEGRDDNIFWRWENSGVYSVKSAYRLLADEAESVNEATGSFWRKFWKLKIPPKVKNMVWRAAANCLPTKVHLRNKKVSVDTLCIHCRNGRETTLHCLVDCPFAAECWAAAGFTRISYDGASFAGWLRLLFQRVDGDGTRRVAMLCWALWRARNDLLWKGRGTVAREVAATARVELDKWCHAKEKGLMPSFSVLTHGDGAEHWSKPEWNKIKVNVDAAIFESLGSFGVGFVARGPDGLIIEAGARCRGGPVSPGIAEAIRVREALSWIKKKGWKGVTIETDCLVVVQSMRSEIAMLSYYGSIIAECKSLLQDLCDVSLVFVRRSANRVAHHLARASYLLSDRIFGADSLPSNIHAFVLDDLSV